MHLKEALLCFSFEAEAIADLIEAKKSAFSNPLSLRLSGWTDYLVIINDFLALWEGELRHLIHVRNMDIGSP